MLKIEKALKFDTLHHVNDLEHNPPVITENDKVKNWLLDKTNINGAKQLGLTGKGVTVAVIDSGVTLNHDDLNNDKIQHFDCATADEICIPTTSEPNPKKIQLDHGTHVSGIIAAKDNNELGLKGIAPNVNIIDLRVFKDGNDEEYANIATIKALEWISEQNNDAIVDNDIQIVNMSLGATGFEADVYGQYITDVFNSGSLIIACAGNDFTDYPVNFPAAYPEVIAVSGTDQNNEIMNMSNQGKKIELAAPGNFIYSTIPYSYYDDPLEIDKDKLGNERGFEYAVGTSMAAPVVTGIAALYKELYPDITNNQLRALLDANAKDLGDPGRDSTYGFGLVQFNTNNPFFKTWTDEMRRSSGGYYNDSLTHVSDVYNYNNPVYHYSFYYPSKWYIDNVEPDKYIRLFLNDFKVETTFYKESDPELQESYVNQVLVPFSRDGTLDEYTTVNGYKVKSVAFTYDTEYPMIQTTFYCVYLPNGILRFEVKTNVQDLLKETMIRILDSIKYDTTIEPFYSIIPKDTKAPAYYYGDNYNYDFSKKLFGLSLIKTSLYDANLTLSDIEQRMDVHFGTETVTAYLNSANLTNGEDIPSSLIQEIFNNGRIPVIDLKTGYNYGPNFLMAFFNGDGTTRSVIDGQLQKSKYKRR